MEPPRPAHMKFLLAFPLVFIATVTDGCRSYNKPKGAGGEVHGVVYTDIADSVAPQHKRQAFLPGVTVFLKDSSTSALSTKVVTNVRGWYAIPHMPAGRYQLCWEAQGYVSGCTRDKQEIVIESSNVAPAPLPISPQAPVLVGRVVFPGNMPCLAQDPFFGLNSLTKLTIVDASGNPVHAAVLANSFGDFVIPAIPPTRPLRLRAECNGITTDAPLPPAGNTTPLKLEFPNANPKIVSLIAGRGPRLARRQL